MYIRYGTCTSGMIQSYMLMDHGSCDHGSESNDWMGGSRMESLMASPVHTDTARKEKRKRMVTLQSLLSSRGLSGDPDQSNGVN